MYAWMQETNFPHRLRGEGNASEGSQLFRYGLDDLAAAAQANNGFSERRQSGAQRTYSLHMDQGAIGEFVQSGSQ